MPRRRVTFTQGAYYHLYNRGAAQRSIFHSDGDYRYLLTLVKRLLSELQNRLKRGELPRHRCAGGHVAVEQPPSDGVE